LASASVVGSSLEGFAILWQDRAIVRDYRTLLQIETKLSQTAFELSKKARLVAKLDAMPPALKSIVQKYEAE